MLRKYRHLFIAHRGAYVAGLLCLLLHNALLLSIPWLIKYAVDSLERDVDILLLGQYAAAIIGITIVQAFVRILSRLYLLGISRKVGTEMRGRLYRHFQMLPPSFYSKREIGDLMSRATNDIQLVRATAGPGVMYFINAIFVYGLSLILMGVIEWRLTLYIFLPLPLLLYGVKKLARILRRYTYSAQEDLSRISSSVQEALKGIQVVKSFVLEGEEAKKFARHNQQYMKDRLGEAKARGALTPLMSIAAGLGTLLVLWVGGGMVVSGDMSFGDFVAFYAYMGRLMFPTLALGWVLNLIQRGVAALERIDDILQTEPTIVDRSGVEKRAIHGHCHFKRFSFSYDGNGHGNGMPALSQISFDVEAGMTCGLVGRIGSGKSTLLRALPRLLEIDPGMIFVDGQDITTLSLSHLRQSVGYVPQNDFLFSVTLTENIAFGSPNASQAAVEEVARLVAIHDEILLFPQGYQTMVGEGGVTLSGGQRQRIALARALLLDPPILVLDDALSRVDTATEKRILQHIGPLLENKTVFIASHRISTVQDADIIVVLDAGEAIDMGTHQTLRKSSSLYQNLYNLQRLGEALKGRTA